jgi:hypothetical protein
VTPPSRGGDSIGDCRAILKARPHAAPFASRDRASRGAAAMPSARAFFLRGGVLVRAF